MQKRLLSVQETAEYLGLKVQTLYNWVSQRKIPFVKCGKLLKFDILKLDRWIEPISPPVFNLTYYDL